ncbi:MAG: hypothetical protein ACRCZM_05920 [Bacteroidales bacterium]
MKRSTVGLMAVMLMCGTLFAEARVEDRTGRPEKMNKEERMKQLKEELNLTKDQETKLMKVWEERDAQAKDMKEKAQANKEEMRSDMSKMKDENLSKMKDILTPEQYTKYLENEAKKAKNSGKAGMKKMGEKMIK